MENDNTKAHETSQLSNDQQAAQKNPGMPSNLKKWIYQKPRVVLLAEQVMFLFFIHKKQINCRTERPV